MYKIQDIYNWFNRYYPCALDFDILHIHGHNVCQATEAINPQTPQSLHSHPLVKIPLLKIKIAVIKM